MRISRVEEPTAWQAGEAPVPASTRSSETTSLSYQHPTLKLEGKDVGGMGWIASCFPFIKVLAKHISFYFTLGWLPLILCFISFYSPEEPWFQSVIAGEIWNHIDLKFRISCKLGTLCILRMGSFISCSWKVIAAPHIIFLDIVLQTSFLILSRPELSDALRWLINLLFQMKYLYFLQMSVPVWKPMFCPWTIHWTLWLWFLPIPKPPAKTSLAVSKSILFWARGQ